MNKIKSVNLYRHLQNIVLFLLFICFTLIIWLIINFNPTNQGYSVFIEFTNAYGIREGTSLRMRGINIGYVKRIKMNLNSILVMVNIESKHIMIPKNSIIETNQTGLLNEAVIDIVPLEFLSMKDMEKSNVFSKHCNVSNIVCHLNYLQGERGLNYDDLIRAATRISQRFDDPVFFNTFYLFLQNSIEISDEIINMTINSSHLISILHQVVKKILRING
uniref:Mce/MlaD domain-containing protein n=1 Tax=Eucheuma denticulatum TaxID=305493 RepID=A0A8E7PGW5_9FLOR|nr:hypothetical protein [Eucheuma denticulatum]